MDRRTSPNLHPETNAVISLCLCYKLVNWSYIIWFFLKDLKHRECVLIHIERMSTSFMVPIVNEAIKMLALSLLPHIESNPLSSYYSHQFHLSMCSFILPSLGHSFCLFVMPLPARGSEGTYSSLNPDEVILW